MCGLSLPEKRPCMSVKSLETVLQANAEITRRDTAPTRSFFVFDIALFKI